MKYVNPGLKILAQDATEIISDIKNPINGHALYDDFRVRMTNIGTDIYCKFDVFCDSKNNFIFSFNNLNPYFGNIEFYPDSSFFIYKDSEEHMIALSSDYILENSLNHFFIHCNRGTIDTKTYRWTGGNLKLKINDYTFTTDLDDILLV